MIVHYEKPVDARIRLAIAEAYTSRKKIDHIELTADEGYELCRWQCAVFYEPTASFNFDNLYETGTVEYNGVTCKWPVE